MDVLPWVSLMGARNNSTFRHLKRQGKTVAAYQDFVGPGRPDTMVDMVSDQEFVESCTHSTEPSYAIMLGVKPLVEKHLSGQGFSVLLPPNPVRRRFGNKNQVQALCKTLELPCNESIELQGVNNRNIQRVFETCERKLGLPFIAQAKWTSGGMGTFLISTRDDLRQALPHIGGGCRAARLIPNSIPFSLQAVIAKEGDIITGPFLQLVGLPELTTKPFEYVGGDSNPAFLSNANRDLMHRSARKISAHLRASGYKGILGIDFLLDPASGEITLQEINPRLTWLTNLITAIQKDQNLGLDFLKHLEAFDTSLPLKGAIAPGVGNIDLETHDYSQAQVHNVTDKNLRITTAREPGIFDFKHGQLTSASSNLCVRNMTEDQVLVTYFPDKGSEVRPDDVLCRIMLKKSLLSTSSYQVSDWGLAVLESLKQYILAPAKELEQAS